MKKTLWVLTLGIGLLEAIMPGGLLAEPQFQEQFSNVSYFPKDKLPIHKVAMSAVNVKVGVHLERLTLISGEGNTDKKLPPDCLPAQ